MKTCCSNFLFLKVLFCVQALICFQGFASSEEKFKPIFGLHGRGGGTESHSGTGSSFENTVEIRRELPRVLAKMNCAIFVDLPCGDFHWMQSVILPVGRYIGVDCIEELIALNNEKFGNSQRSFLHRDALTQNLPQGDVVFCRDMLVHLSYKDIWAFFRNLKKSNSKYILMTHFSGKRLNKDIRTGGWRPLNFTLPPFCFPEPLLIIEEHCLEFDKAFYDKSVALWEIAALPIEEIVLSNLKN